MIKLSSIVDELNEEQFLEGLELDPDFNIDDIEKSKIFPFEIDDKKYEVRVDLKKLLNNKTIGDFKFYLLNNPKAPQSKDFMDVGSYFVALQKSRIGITGTGNYFKILTRVINIIVKYCETNKIDYITFTADEENRRDLYRKIMNKLIKKYNISYKEININPTNNNKLNSNEFWMQRI